MQFLKEHGYGGVIIWSLDLDDKTGGVCNEGPFPIFNAAKRELLILPDHLVNKDKICSDENITIASEHLLSKMTRIKQSKIRNEIRLLYNYKLFVLDFFFLFYLVLLDLFK